MLLFGNYVITSSIDNFFLYHLVLSLVKSAQQQHGLRHGDYQRYHQYISRKLRRMRKSLHFQQVSNMIYFDTLSLSSRGIDQRLSLKS